MVSLFRYLGRTLSVVDDEWPAVITNLCKAWKVWDRLLRIMSRKRVNRRTLRRIYVEVVQATLIFGSRTWVAIPYMARNLGGFHHHVVWKISENPLKQRADGE